MRTLRLYDGYTHTSPQLREDVVELQKLLNEKMGLTLAIDGLFGRTTEDAVERFQYKFGLSQDGIVGAKTWSALKGTPQTIEPTAKEEEGYPTTIAYNNKTFYTQLKAGFTYHEAIQEAAEKAGVPIEVIYAIGSRETAWGTSRALDKPGPAGRGDHGHGHGLMQIDDRSHKAFIRSGKWSDPRENLLYAATVLNSMRTFLDRHTALSEEALERATIAAYNCGGGNVAKALKNGRDMDYYTAGRDYSRDVLNRAGWFHLRGVSDPDFHID